MAFAGCDASMPIEGAQYTATEQQAIRDAYAATRAATCPRCTVAMSARSIGGGSFGLGYARRREWLICPQCRRSVLFDLKRGTRN
jgi:hypothetical protein